MVLDLDIPTDIISMPTVRDTHGLALSSRNAYLSAPELEVARHLNRILEHAAASAASGKAPGSVEAEATASILNAGFNAVDYVAIRKSDDLSVFTDGVIKGPARILAAARIGTTRLIDNMAI
jgi:pantoate--beta-alanine ligase